MKIEMNPKNYSFDIFAHHSPKIIVYNFIKHHYHEFGELRWQILRIGQMSWQRK